MTVHLAESALPPDLLARASLRGKEYAWPVADIPRVIEAAKAVRLVNIGGQLQFRLPDGGTCECYWVQVDTYRTVDTSLPWNERVLRTAEAAAQDFAALREQFDFVAEGRNAFAEHLDKLLDDGREPAEAMCFVWYVLSEDEALAKGQ